MNQVYREAENTMQHVTIYREAGRYAGWPANYGIWSWGDEIVVGFTLGYHDPEGGFHTRDKTRPFVAMQARSLDGGQNWEVGETPCRTPGNRGLSADEHVNAGLQVGEVLTEEGEPCECPGDVDFTHPDFALMCGRSGLEGEALSWFYVSDDRCQAWRGPYRLPMFGQPGIAARTDYIVLGKDECTLFLTAAKLNAKEGRTMCARTTDGGRSIQFLSWIGAEPEGYTIMPASVRLPDQRILVAVRCQAGKGDFEEAKSWIDLYCSQDNCATWEYVNRPVEDTGRGGNPPTLTLLQDGRLCLVYGHRAEPFGIRARLSEDEGSTWGEDRALREDGGNPDLGYPRTVQRTDGTMVTVYYYNEHAEGDRYIAATLWEL